MNLLLVVLVAVLLAVLLGGGTFTYRRYFSTRPAGADVAGRIEGGGAAVAVLVIAGLVILFLIYGGFALFHWFTFAPPPIPVRTVVAH